MKLPRLRDLTPFILLLVCYGTVHIVDARQQVDEAIKKTQVCKNDHHG